MKAISNDDLDGIVSVMERLCKMTEGRFHKPLEKFKLALANKCLQSSNLAKRLYGLNTINKLIEMAGRKDTEDRHKCLGMDMTYDYLSLFSPPPKVLFLIPSKTIKRYITHMTQMGKGPPTTKWITVPYMIAWLQKVNIVEELFGKKIHSELVGRSQDILRLLTQHNQFKEEYLDLLWNAVAGKGKQERIIEIVFSMVEVLTPFFTPEHVDYLLSKIRDSEAYESKSLLLMKLLTLQQLSEDEDQV